MKPFILEKNGFCGSYVRVRPNKRKRGERKAMIVAPSKDGGKTITVKFFKGGRLLKTPYRIGHERIREIYHSTFGDAPDHIKGEFVT